MSHCVCVLSRQVADGTLCRSETSSDLQFAADAAAFFSKARSEGKADVVYAYVKDLKKPKGARPGQVQVFHWRCEWQQSCCWIVNCRDTVIHL